MNRAGDAPPGRRHAFRLVLWGLGTVVVLAAAIAAIAGAIVLSGSTEIGLVRERVEAALAAALGPDFDVSVGRAVMRVDGGLVIDLEGIAVRDRAGATVATVPATRLGIDALALVGFNLVVTDAALSAPTLALVRDSAGRVRPGGMAEPDPGPPAATDEALPGLPQLADRIAGVEAHIATLLADPALAHVAVSVTDGTVMLADAVSGNVRRFDDVTVTGATDAGAGSAAARISAEGESGQWSATFGRRIEPATGDRVVSLAFSQVTLADLVAGLEGTAAAQIPLFGGADIVVDDRGMRDASLRLDIGAGVIDLGTTPDETMLLDEASIRARWDGAAGELVFEPSSVHFGPTGGTFTGVVRDEGGGRYMFALESADAVLAARDTGAPPLALRRLELAGSADVPGRRLDVDRLVLQADDGALAAAVRLGFTGETPSLAVAAELTPMAIATWTAMWPPFLAPGARQWAIDNISAGRIASARFDASVPAGELFRREPPRVTPEQFRLDLRLEDVTVATFGGLPPLTGAAGRAKLSGATFGVDLDPAAIRTDTGKTVAVTDGRFAIEDVFDPQATGVVDVSLAGTAEAIGALADAEPFRALARRAIVPADLSGTAEVTVTARVPLQLDAATEPAWRVTVRGTDLASRKPVDGRSFRDADVTIVVAANGVTIDGTAEIDGVAAAVSLSQPLSRDGSNAPGAQQAAALSLDRDARLRLGLDIEDIVSGVVDANVRSLPGGGEHYELDLRRAGLVLPGLGWSKTVGMPATMAFDLHPAEGGGQRVDNMTLAGDGFGFSGSALIDAGDGLASARLERFHLVPGDDVTIDIERRGGGYAIAVDGESFDIRGVIAELKDDGGDEAGDGEETDITLDARVRKLRGHGPRAIGDASVSFVLAGGVPRRLTVNGKLAGGPVSLAWLDDLDHASLKATAANAGAVLAYLDVYERVSGGQLIIAGERPAPTGPLSGTMSIAGFAILDEPAMREVVTRAKGKNADRIDPAKMHVEAMDAVFRYTGDAIFIDDGFLRGSAMGATFNGVLDLVRAAVSISGTYIPLFGLNNAFTKVPVVGRILGGESGQGLIGVTFKVEGPLDSPRVLVNPLSAVAPGILRKIFEYK